MSLKLKVCGMRESGNITELLALSPDYMGFIFYDKSPRDVENYLDENLLMTFPRSTHKTGVFVNAELDFVADKIKKYRLDAIQLHGSESPTFVHNLLSLNPSHDFEIIKAFAVDESFDFLHLAQYENADFFLFDTKGTNHGGNGNKFNWKILETAAINKPFFLSGGLSFVDLKEINELKSKVPNLYALDINSKFEISPGLKNIDKIRELISAMDNEKNNQ